MEGITILATNTYSPPLWLAILLCTFMTLFVMIALGLICVAFRGLELPHKISYSLLAIFTAVLILLLVFVWKDTIAGTKKTYTAYTITIDDSVGYNEFTEKYEIISHKGDTYVVRERPTE